MLLSHQDYQEVFNDLKEYFLSKQDNNSAELIDKIFEEMPYRDFPTQDFKDLLELVESDDWDVAVDPSLICDEASEVDKQNRAEVILDLYVKDDVAGLKFLDFGCGEGHAAKQAIINLAAFSVGYDIKLNVQIPQEQNLIYTNDLDVVAKHGPYDVILLYDVLDHVVDDPVDVLKRVKSLLSADGRIHARCHPWCSKHGGHIYKSFNKAFAHLVFTEEELKQFGVKVDCPQKVIHPLNTYESWFKEAGLSIIESDVKREYVSSIISQNPIATRILDNWNGSTLLKKGVFPFFQLSQGFLDYILK